jgi:hypothetical protein
MWLVGDAQIIDEQGCEIQQAVRAYKRFWRSLYRPWVISILNPIPQPAVFIRTEAIEKAGLFNVHLRFVMDYEYWQRLQNKFGDPVFVKESLAAFRIHEASKGGSQFIEQFAEELKIAEQFSNSRLTLFFHRFHNLLITSVYRMIK